MNLRFSEAGLMADVRLPAIALTIAAFSTLAVTALQSGSSSSSAEGTDQVSPGETVTDAETASTFLVVAGGGAPSYNEIALEKNVWYFQRTLTHLGAVVADATVFFANGNDQQATIRYLDPLGQEQFKAPDVEFLTGAATRTNVQGWLDAYPQTDAGIEDCPVLMYFTGHGALNPQNNDDNALILWEEALLSVQDLAQTLDHWPTDIPFVTMMAQCYSGSFANLIYEGGDPEQPVALQSRCGFFATIKTRPSVGCTPLVNEADYRDYSSSFFAGLSGRDRLGHPVASADYDTDGQVSFAEAHAFAKVDGETSDWPISTAEAWLHQQALETDKVNILAAPMVEWLAVAPPERRFVIQALSAKLGYNLTTAFADSPTPRARWSSPPQEVLTAYHQRLRMELINVGMEQAIRSSGDQTTITTLEKLLACESGSW
ncbi:MAG: Caspase domain-containing protein [Cyanobacteria bacterium P01_C01_bin.70]